MEHTKNFIVLFGTFLLCTSARATPEADFESLLREHNADIKALHTQSEVLKDNLEEAEVLYAWQLFGNLGLRQDQSPSSSPGFSYEAINSKTGQIGVQKFSPWGLETKLFLDSSQTQIENGNAGFGTFDSSSWQTRPSIEIRLPLISGGFGRGLRADHAVLVQQKRIEALSAEIEYDQKIQEAKTLLWSTILQRESLNNQQQTLERIAKIYKIAQTQAQRNLEASSNFLQARSALEQAELDLKLAQLKFSRLEALLKIVLDRVPGFQIPTYDFSKFRPVSIADFVGRISAQERLDNAAQELRASQAQSREEASRSRLDLVGSYSQTGQDNAWSPSLSESLGNRHPTAFVGLQWSLPLELGLAKRSRERQSTIERSAIARKSYLQGLKNPALTQDLVSQYNQSVELMALNRKLEETQAKKLENERGLLAQGRSSIYQVLQFELDLARAQTGKFSLALELETLHQQLSLKKHLNYE